MSVAGIGVGEGSAAMQAPGTRAFGLMRIAGALLALPAEAIREVIPAPAQYSHLPMQGAGLLGSMNLRGDVVFVLDLRLPLGLPPSGTTAHIVVVMRWSGLLLGLVADEVCGIAHVANASLLPLTVLRPSGAPTLVTHIFQMQDEAGCTANQAGLLLDPERIASLPNVPLAAEQALHKPKASASQQSILLFSYRGCHFGIEATSVDGAVSKTAIKRNALTSGYCLGVIAHRGYEIPVVDTLAAAGLGSHADTPDLAFVVVQFPEGGQLGFALDEVRDIARVAPADIVKLPFTGALTTRLFRGMLCDATRQHLVLDIDALGRDQQLLNLARLRRPVTATGVADTGTGPVKHAARSATLQEPYLVYVAGVEQVTLLTQISEVLPLPANITPFGDDDPNLLGLFTHRGTVMPIVRLAGLLGETALLDPTTACILVVGREGATVGFVIEELRGVETSQWEPSEENQHRSLLPAMVMFHDGSRSRMRPKVDLRDYLRPFAGPDAVEWHRSVAQDRCALIGVDQATPTPRAPDGFSLT